LLGQARVGRVAVSRGEVPAIFPVNYALAGDEIVFFTGEGTKLRAATTNVTVAFEVDHIDPFAQTGPAHIITPGSRQREPRHAATGRSYSAGRSLSARGRHAPWVKPPSASSTNPAGDPEVVGLWRARA